MASGFSSWQAAVLSLILGWVVLSSYLGLTHRMRSLLQPWVIRRVFAETPAILEVQKWKHASLDVLFSVASCIVSVPFYTGFLPLLFWSGHGKLARQMTFLMAFCDYIGNTIKDVVSAPRPSSPPVRRVTATSDEKENAMEYGLPSSHVLNTVCLTGYLLHYASAYGGKNDAVTIASWFMAALLLVVIIGAGRIYLGMHTLTDVIAGFCIGVVVLCFWLSVNDFVDDFVISDQNVMSFWSCLSLLLCFAYPTPKDPTPSYEYHTAFNGVAFGIVSGVQLTYSQFHHPDIPRIFSSQFPITLFLGRVLVGMPTILFVKFCSKALAKWLLPVMCSTLGIPIISTSYVPALKVLPDHEKTKPDTKQAGYLHRVFSLFPQKTFDVDTGIRFLQYAGLAWSVVDLVPSIFVRLGL